MKNKEISANHISRENVANFVDNVETLDNAIKFARANEKYVVNSVPSFWLISNLFNRPFKEYIDPIDKSLWKEITFLCDKDKDTEWSFYLEGGAGAQHLDSVDFIVLNFFLQRFLRNLDYGTIEEFGRIPDSYYKTKFLISDIMRFIGMIKSGTNHTIVKRSVIKILKTRIMLRKKRPKKRDAVYIGALLENIAENFNDEVLTSTAIGAWVVICSTLKPRFVNIQLLNEVRKNELAFQILNLRYYFYNADTFEDNDGSTYKLYGKPKEGCSDFMRRLESALNLLKTKGIVESFFTEKKKNGKWRISITWVSWKNPKSKRPNELKPCYANEKKSINKNTPSTKKIDRKLFFDGLLLSHKIAIRRVSIS